MTPAVGSEPGGERYPVKTWDNDIVWEDADGNPATPPSSVAERGGLEDAIGRLVGVAGTIAGHRGGMTFEGFYHHPYWWADLDAALAEVQQAREAAATPVAERGGLREALAEAGLDAEWLDRVERQAILWRRGEDHTFTWADALAVIGLVRAATDEGSALASEGGE